MPALRWGKPERFAPRGPGTSGDMETQSPQDREANTDHSATQPGGSLRQLGDVVNKGTPVMLVTTGPEGLDGRPLTCGSAEERTLRFLVDRTAAWMAELQEAGATADGHLVVADPGHSRFVWANVTLTLAVGRGEVDALWSPAVAAFFEGPDDPNLGVLEVVGHSGQWWEGPGSALGRAVAITRAAVTQNPEPLADHGQLG